MVQDLNIARVLVVNAGSSSLKFKVFTADTLQPLIGGLFDRIGDLANSTLIAKSNPSPQQPKPQKWELKQPFKDHTSAMSTMLEFLTDNLSKGFRSEVRAVGHRIVHGLDVSAPVLLSDSVLEKVRQAAILAPLHNPPGLSGILAAKDVFKNVPQVGVFDTAYHATMPAKAYMYGLPYDLYEKHLIRRYGFHGTSHKYLVEQAAQMLGKPLSETNVITCHLGNGSSVAAVKGGLSVDTSMGMTPLEGLVMGTRCGDLDPAVVLHLQNQLGLSTKETDTLLNKKSGLLGVTGHSDLRAVVDAAAAGDARGQLGLDMFVYRVRKYIGSYMAALDGKVDAVIFSAGIGENSSSIRGMICSELQGLGIMLDEAANKATVGGKQADIAAPGSRVRLLVVPTDEELSIAQQTLQVVNGGSSRSST